jgi:hypothetical protein
MEVNIKSKTRLRNLLTGYRNEVCEEAVEDAEVIYGMTKCEVCDLSMSDGTCMIDVINLKLENELWEG